LSTSVPVNLLLQGLPRKDRDLIMKQLVPIDMQFGDILCGHDQPYQDVYFPLSGFISLMVVIDNHPPLEVGLIGNEGMLGVTLVLGVNNSPQHAVVQGAGTALRMTSSQLIRVLRASPALLKSMNRYQYVLLAQLSQLAACTHFHEVDARLARWLLMTHDRAEADNFHLTHQYLADMLGVQRSAVTIAAGILQKRKLISYSRGEITVLKRKGLEAVSCECYDAIIQDYAQQFS
jgi:CRP-like cAMP-binding protein